MKSLLLLGLGLVVALALVAWRLDSTSVALDLGHGAAYVTKRVNGITLKLVFFDESKASIRVVSNPLRANGRTLDAWGRDQGAIAVCNGGYFDVGKLLPSGLEIAQGRRTGTLVRGEWEGALVGTKGKASLVWNAEFRDDPAADEFLQCSPWLVSDGRAAPFPKAAKPEAKNARTFVLTDMLGHWAIGITEGVTLTELAEILATAGVITEFPVKRALNLDGGPSTGLWFKTADGRENLEKPAWIVRNGIAVVPK